jgi:probable HAF family extracellular repeat protein
MLVLHRASGDAADAELQVPYGSDVEEKGTQMHMLRWLRCFACLLGSVAPLVAGAQQLTGLGFLVVDVDFDIGRSSASGISADGRTVVGTSDTWEGPGAFLWTRDGGMLEIGDMLGGVYEGSAAAVSADGTSVVGVGSVALGRPRFTPFQWTEESGFKALVDTIYSVDAFANAIAGNGDVIGGTLQQGFFFDRTAFFAVRWRRPYEGASFFVTELLPRLEEPADHVPDMGSVSGVSANGSVLVGYAWSAAGIQAARWIGGGVAGLGDLAGGDFHSRATDVSADGERIVGQGSTDAGHEAFLWTFQQGMVSIGDLPGGPVESIPNAISADGTTIVGDASVEGGVHPFIWTQAGGMRDLYDLAGRAARGWVLQSAAAVNADGTVIAGTGVNPDGRTEAWVLDLLPEPDQALGALVACGALASLSTFRRRAPFHG